jgi:ribose 5-phosphate isomerase B
VKIAVSADHRGKRVHSMLVRALGDRGHDVVKVRTCDMSSCDYPDMAYDACSRVAEGAVDRAILICGSGIGMSLAANKVKGIRAALVHDEIGAELSRSHNDANVLCMSADMLNERLMLSIVDKWLTTDFEGGRHARRVRKIMAIERGEDPATITD